MPLRLRSRRAREKPADRDLLQSLIETPPDPTERRLAPIALRSAKEQRRHALRGFLLRSWVDTLLTYGERAVVLATLLFFGYWLADGPVRDWLHTYQNPVAPPSAAVAVAPTARARAQATPATARPARLLPYVNASTTDAAPPPPDEFIAPRQAVIDEPVVAPQPTRLQIPAISLDTPVKEVFVVDGAWEVADYAAGYLHGTGLPGDPGNAVLAGHAGLRGAVFRDLGALAPGDEVYLDAGGWRWRYRVRESRSVWPEQVEVLDPTSAPTLTMLTCTNWDTQRLVVIADLVDSQALPRP